MDDRQALIDALVLDIEDAIRKHLSLTGYEIGDALSAVAEQYGIDTGAEDNDLLEDEPEEF